jgi:O-antigen ligase
MSASQRSGFFSVACGWSAAVLVFSAPISRSLYIVAGLIFCLCWFAEGRFREKWVGLRSLPVTAPILLLSGVVLVWSLVAAVLSTVPVQTLKVYSKLPLILMLVTTWSDDRWRRVAWQAFVIAMTIVVLSTVANIWLDLPWSRSQNQGLGQDHSVFIDYVSQSLMCVLFFCYCVQRLLFTRVSVKNYFWVLMSVLCLGTILFLLRARSGLVALLVASAVLVCFYTPRKRLIQVVLGLVLVGVLLIAGSPLMRAQLITGYLEVTQYKPFEVTSLGARIDMWRFAIDQSIDHSLLGTGAGTYRDLAARHFGHCTWVCEHPHNQYLFFSMEYGALGLAAYLWMLWRMFSMGFQSSAPSRALLVAWVAILAVDSLFNVPLWYRGQSYFFFSMLALLLASAQSDQTLSSKGSRSGLA